MVELGVDDDVHVGLLGQFLEGLLGHLLGLEQVAEVLGGEGFLSVEFVAQNPA